MVNHSTYASGSELSLSKKLYNKSAYLNTINNSFTELVPSQPEEISPPTIEEFFQLYDELFYEIPKEGEINSHEYLVKQSTNYIGSQIITEDIQALLEEITSLREENLALQQNIVDLTLPTNGINNTTK
jgi:hypothetical protein